MVFRRGEANDARTLQVIGVVGDMRIRSRDVPRAHVYLPLQQLFVPRVTIAARAHDGRSGNELRAVVASRDRNLPILRIGVASLAHWALTRLNPDFPAIDPAAFAAAAALLSAIAVAACYEPARRALALDPSATLSTE